MIKIFRLIFKTEVDRQHGLKKSLLLERTAEIVTGCNIKNIGLAKIDVIIDNVPFENESAAVQYALEEGLNRIKKEVTRIISVTCEELDKRYMVTCEVEE